MLAKDGAGHSPGTLTKTGYLPYGESSSTSGSFRYTGQRIDPETNGLYYYRARHYMPAWGRFMQADPIGYGGGNNLYAYVANDPINNVDPGGTCPQCLAAAVVGAVGGLVVQAGIDLWHGQLSSGSGYAGAIAGGAAGGAAALVCGPACAGATAGAASNFVTQSINATYGGNVSATSFAVDTAIGFLGGKIAGTVVPYVFTNYVSPGVKGALGENLTTTGLILTGETNFQRNVPNGIGRSTFDFQLSSGQFVESKFGTGQLSTEQRAAARLLGDQLDVHYWDYPTVSGAISSGIGAGAAGTVSLK